jgi:hypothetical protein
VKIPHLFKALQLIYTSLMTSIMAASTSQETQAYVQVCRSVGIAFIYRRRFLERFLAACGPGMSVPVLVCWAGGACLRFLSTVRLFVGCPCSF